MKTLFKFLKTTVLGGMLFLFPLALVVMALSKLLHFVVKFVGPLAKRLPFESAIGIETPYFVAVLILFLVSFLAGLIARTALGSRLKAWFENTLLQVVPGYTLLKGLAQETGNADTATMTTALLGGSGNWQLCFIVERHANGYLTVFRPGAPNPSSGSVSFVSSDQVQEVDVPVADAMKCLMRDGAGAVELLQGKLKARESVSR